MTERFDVPPALAGERVDRAVALLTGWTRAEVQELLERGAIRVGGRAVAKSHRLAEGDAVDVLEPPATSGPPEPDPAVVVPVVAEDASVIVVDKPAGLVVHPGAGHPGGTLVNGLLARYPELATVGDAARPGIVHRLDRDTSGLMLVARSQPAYDALVAALAERRVERRYLALVWGVPESTHGVVDAPIGRSVRQPTRMAVREGGREARTRYEVRARYSPPGVALLECTLETGRTHQIRVHLAAIGHPVVGDAVYGGRRRGIEIERPFLHAAVLGYPDPVSGEWRRFESPLPPDLAGVLERLDATRTSA